MESEIDAKSLFNSCFKVARIIQLVKERPVIWDRTVEGYRNRDVSVPAWQEICRIMFNNYDLLSEEQKKYIGKLVKDKWTNAKDTWQRMHRKKKEAMQRGERYELKDPARYDQLKFLIKVYDKDDCLMTNKSKGKIVLPNSGNVTRPSPSAVFSIFDPDAETVLNTIKDCTSNAGVSADDKKSGKHNLTLSSSKKRKSDNNNVMSFKPNLNQVKYLNGGGATEDLSIIPVKRLRTSSIESREAEQIKSPTQVQSRGQTHPIDTKTEILPSSGSLPLHTDAHVVEIPRKLKLEVKSPCQLIEREATPRPSTSTESHANSIVVEKTDVKVPPGNINAGQTSQRRPALDDVNEELDNFFQILRLRIEDFDKSQMISFFLEIMKPRLKDFSKPEMLDFQIEALTLIKNIEQRKKE